MEKLLRVTAKSLGFCKPIVQDAIRWFSYKISRRPQILIAKPATTSVPWFHSSAISLAHLHGLNAQFLVSATPAPLAGLTSVLPAIIG